MPVTVKKPRKVHWMRVFWVGKGKGKTSCGQMIRERHDVHKDQWFNHDNKLMDLATWPLTGKDVTCKGCRAALDAEAAEDAVRHKAATYCPV